MAADPENLPELLFCCDAVMNCLDSIPKKKMFGEAACAKGIPLCLALFLATRALPSGPSQESCAYTSPGKTHGQISESRLHLVHCFHWAAMRFVVLLKSPEKGACKTSGVLQRSGKGRPFPARESEAVSKEPTPHNFCLEGVGVEDFHARDRQHGNTHQLCLLFPVPGHMLFFQG